MNDYKKEPRLIFKDTVRENLIGPGSDIFISNSEEEIISDSPLSRYYSGILFPERLDPQLKITFGEEAESNLNSELVDGEEDDVSIAENDEAEINGEEAEKGLQSKAPKDEEPEYSDANQYFPTNFGLTFCVPTGLKSIDVVFQYARYRQLKPAEAKVEISEKEYKKFTEHPHNFISHLLRFENGLMFLDPETFSISDLTVRNYKSRFKETEEQQELIGSEGYIKTEMLLGKLWKREKPIIIEQTVELGVTQDVEAKEYTLASDEETNSVVSCYYKKIYETEYGKFIKIILANRNTHPKKKFSIGNEILNRKCLFQGEIIVKCERFLPYKQLSERNPFDDELNTINFQYRNEHSFAIGHGCAVNWNDEHLPTEIKTTFLPEVDIKHYSNTFRKDFPEELRDITEIKQLSIWSSFKKGNSIDKMAIISKLKLFANEYKKWTEKYQETSSGLQKFEDSFKTIIDKQHYTYNRLIKNIEFLEQNELAFKSFLLANTSMYIQMLISNKNVFGKKGVELEDLNDTEKYKSLEFFENFKDWEMFNPSKPEPLKYRPFQLAFFLLNVESIINEKSKDRKEVVDLLWFPTGGGKTEAYLALTAFTIISRRMMHKVDADGVSVIMRYTLRLLTAQQFERATKLILSLDFLRRQFDESKEYYFGSENVSIGMWVGASTTPNSYKDAKRIWKKISDEITKLNGKKGGDYEKVNTFPIQSCSWCGCNLVTKNKIGYYVQGYIASDSNFQAKCLNTDCAFEKELPIYFVDDKIYTNPPTLLFATVDKFAMLSHRNEGYKLFNSLSSNDQKLPPDLIIQDELHLLSGPLGSITGLYESIVELLSTKGDRKPKIIASTATTRNTAHQVAMLYGNRSLNIFPPLGVTYDDNFFSFVSNKSKRKHIGIMPTGKTALNTQIRMLGSLMLSRIKLYKLYKENDVLSEDEINELLNNYWTIVSFYNSLKDVGKIYNKIPAEVTTYIKHLHSRNILNKQMYGLNYFGLNGRTKELTSRIESNLIKKLLDELEEPFKLIRKEGWTFIDGTVDLVLASNMFSVGIDIERLNVMLMNGQPKNIAEYIQASSRVGRKEKGIVFNLLDANRSRDKSYFENYVPFNSTYYKYVEPLSVTPYTEIALDKVVASLLVCFVRHKQGLKAKDYKGSYEELKDFITERIKNKKQLAYALNKLEEISDKWLARVSASPNLSYKDKDALIQKMSDLSDWSLMMSMREIDTDSVIEINF